MAAEHIRKWQIGDVEVVRIVEVNAHEDPFTMLSESLTPEIAKTVYKEQMPMFSRDGRFDPKALAVVERTFSDLALLDHTPDMKTLYTEEFLPHH